MTNTASPFAPIPPQIFRKGDRVYLIGSYDRMGAVSVTPCVVDSWGKTQVHLREESTGECTKHRHYVTALGATYSSFQIVGRDVDPVATGLEYARRILACTFAEIVARESRDEWYREKCAPNRRAELHAPEVFVGGRAAVYSAYLERKPAFRPYLVA